MPLELSTYNGSQVFVSKDLTDPYSRVYGAFLDKVERRYVYPAYPPFGSIVLRDLRTIVPGLEVSAEVEEHARYLDSVKSLVDARTLPGKLEFVTQPMDHQLEGLIHLWHHPRSALLWDAGCGKTKPVIDLARMLPGELMVVCTPKITVMNWVKEIQKHAGGQLRVGALIGAPEKKRAVINNAKDYDIIVMSYGSARTLGLPRCMPSAVAKLKWCFDPLQGVNEETNEPLPQPARRITASGLAELSSTCSYFSDPAKQVEYIDRWLTGTSFAQLKRDAIIESAKMPQWVVDIPYKILVADESHRIKEATSEQTKAMIALSKRAARRYIMSGTVSLGDPRDLYTQMKFLAPCIIPEDSYKFQDMFLEKSPRNKFIVTGFKNLDILNRRLARVSMTKTKDECLDLPERPPPIDISFELSAEQKRLYNALISDMQIDLSSYFQGIADAKTQLDVQNAATLLNKLAQVTSGFIYNGVRESLLCDGCPHLIGCLQNSIQPYTKKCKVLQVLPDPDVQTTKENRRLEAFEELLDNLLANPDNKVIVWSVYHPEMMALRECLENRGINYATTQGVSDTKIQKEVDRFETDPSCRVWLGQIATGIGITLNAAAYTIYYSLDWSLDSYLQSIDRNYRVGQTKKVFVYRLLGAGTVDEYKALALDNKKDISAILTSKLSCISCDNKNICLPKNINLFDKECIYQINVTKTTAKAKTLE